jgi:hypothetical protein
MRQERARGARMQEQQWKGTQTIPKPIVEVDNDTYDEDKGGIVIDTAGVFCAVISDQQSDLYIDKSNLMPGLISEGDETDKEDESPLDRCTNEVSIVRTNLHTFDSKQFSYEAVSAELDRYLDGPQSTIVYSIQFWNDTRDAQDSDMLQQIFSS